MNSKWLPAWTVVHIVSLIVVATILGASQTAFTAYLATLIIYWISCWAIIFLLKPRLPSNENPAKTHLIFDLLPFIPVLVILSVAIASDLAIPRLLYTAIILGLAMMNGFTEEMYWRRLYVNAFPTNISLGFITPWILFSFWHIALLRIPEINYKGGALGLISGAAILGFLWGLSYWKNRRYWVVGLAHTLVNSVAFTLLAIDNAWLS